MNPPTLLCFARSGEILGVYLPPHSKKFTNSYHCYLEPPILEQKVEDRVKVTAVQVCK